MEQLALFNQPAPAKAPQPQPDIPRATDVGGIALVLRNISEPEVKVIDGIKHVISSGYAHVTMELDEDNTAVIQLKNFPHPHWHWQSKQGDECTYGAAASFEDAHKEILKLWNKGE